MSERDCSHTKYLDVAEIVVADSFTIGFCKHGYGHIGFWMDGEKQPFAVAYFGPDNTPELARAFFQAVQPEGHA